jgi:hypothetical protein
MIQSGKRGSSPCFYVEISSKTHPISGIGCRDSVVGFTGLNLRLAAQLRQQVQLHCSLFLTELLNVRICRHRPEHCLLPRLVTTTEFIEID